MFVQHQPFQLHQQRHEVMSKRTQEDAGEERIKAKSKLMTNLVSRCRVRDPTVLASTASETTVDTKSESQNCTSELVECAENKCGETHTGR